MEDTAYSLDRFRAAAAALGDPRRLEIVRVLLEGPCTVLEIARQTGLRQPLVSHHLSVLVQAGIATARKDGRFRHYRLRDAGEEVGERFVRLLRAELDLPEAAEPANAAKGAERKASQKAAKPRSVDKSPAAASAAGLEETAPDVRRSVRESTKRTRRSGATNGDSRAVFATSQTPVPQRYVVDWTRDPAPKSPDVGSPVGLAARRRVPATQATTSETSHAAARQPIGQPIGRPNDFVGPPSIPATESLNPRSSDTESTETENVWGSRRAEEPAREPDPRVRESEGDSSRSGGSESEEESDNQVLASNDEPVEDSSRTDDSGRTDDSSRTDDSDLEDFLL